MDRLAWASQGVPDIAPWSGADVMSVLLMSSLALELSSLSLELSVESIVEGLSELLSLELVDSSVRALREVVLVCVRVSVLAAPERSFVTAPMSELVPVAGSLAEAEGVVDGDAVLDGLDVELGFVLLPYDGVDVDDEGDDIVELELLVLGADSVVVVVVVLLELDDDEGVLDSGDELEVDDGEVPSAVRHSALRCVSVVELECVAESLPLIELGVFVELGVF